MKGKLLETLFLWTFLIKFNPNEEECPLIIFVLSEKGSEKAFVAFKFFSLEQMEEELGKLENIGPNIQRQTIENIRRRFHAFPEKSDHQCEVSWGEEAEEVYASTQGVITLHDSLKFERIEVVAIMDGTLVPKD